MSLNESTVEDAALSWFGGAGLYVGDRVSVSRYNGQTKWLILPNRENPQCICERQLAVA